MTEPHAARRRAVYDLLGPSVAVFAAAPVALRNNDVEHEYRQDSDFYYLTGFDEPESVLVLTVDALGAGRSLWFVRPRDPTREMWDGARAGVDGVVERFGADEAYPIGELTHRLPEVLKDHQRLYYRLGRDRAFDDRVFAALDVARARARAGFGFPTEIVEPGTVLHELRLHKTRDELALMRHAAEITRDGYLAAMRFSAPGRYEYEVEAVLREAFRRRGAERHAYSPIVGGGANATVLHYRANRDRLDEGALLLIDAGCEYRYYASDVTRTFPVSGRFSAAQRAVYQAVLEAQIAGIAQARCGRTLDDVHRACVNVLTDALLSLGLLAGERQKAIDEGAYKKFYMHKTSHYLGMDVHDVGAYFVDHRPRPLGEGVVITVEPGLYFGANDPTVLEEFRGIGIRIEDDVVVTDGAPLVLTADIPKTVDDVERACAG